MLTGCLQNTSDSLRCPVPVRPWDSTQVQHNVSDDREVSCKDTLSNECCTYSSEAACQVPKFKPRDLHNRRFSDQIQHVARRATSSLSTNGCTCMLDDESGVTTADGSIGLDPRCCSSWCHGSARRAESWGRCEASFNPHKRDRCRRSQATPLRLPEVQDHLLAGRGKSCVGGRPGGVLPGA